MNGHRIIARLFILAAVCAAGAGVAAARQQTARVARDDGRAAAVVPPVNWSEVQVEFEGNRLFTGEQLLGLAKQCMGDSETSFLDRLDYCLRRDVVNFMRRSGYVRAHIGDPQVQKLWPGIKLTVPVEEGELYRLGEIKIEGAEFFTAQQLRKLLPLKKGEIADGGAVVRWLGEHLKRDYENNGFIQYEYDVEPQFKLEPGAEEGVVDFLVTITEGKQFVVRGIELKGDVPAPEELLRKASLLKEGEAFSAQKFRDSVNRLNDLLDLEAFEEVDADKDSDFRTDEEGGVLFITIRLRERPPETREALRRLHGSRGRN